MLSGLKYFAERSMPDHTQAEGGMGAANKMQSAVYTNLAGRPQAMIDGGQPIEALW